MGCKVFTNRFVFESIEFFLLLYRYSCQTYEGGFGACSGAEAHGGYSFCGYATLILLNRETLCDRDSLLVNSNENFI